jgi:uroporphyrinogen-III synthase
MKVQSIAGAEVRADVITQAELKKLRDASWIAWQSAHAVHVAMDKIAARIAAGATVQPGELFFEPEVAAIFAAGQIKRGRNGKGIAKREKTA